MQIQATVDFHYRYPSHCSSLKRNKWVCSHNWYLHNLNLEPTYVFMLFLFHFIDKKQILICKAKPPMVRNLRVIYTTHIVYLNLGLMWLIFLLCLNFSQVVIIIRGIKKKNQHTLIICPLGLINLMYTFAKLFCFLILMLNVLTHLILASLKMPVPGIAFAIICLLSISFTSYVS